MKKLFVGLLVLALSAAPALAQVYAPIPVEAAGLSNTPVTLKGAAGELQWAICANANASIQYVQVYDVAGVVTPGTTASTLSLPLAPSTVTVVPLPSQFFNAIKVAATTTAGGGTAPATAVDCNFGIN